MSTETITVRVGNQNLIVPVFIDQETTHQVAKLVSERLREIEGQSARIDSQRFALLAAMHFACEWEGARREAEQETKDFVKALSRIADTLHRIVETL